MTKSSNFTSENLLIRLDGAGVVRNGRWLARQIDLEVNRQEIVTLIGPNGSGKSTTAKMALRIWKPNEGQVWQRSGLKIGYVPQKIHIDKALPLNVTRLMRLTSKLNFMQIEAALDEVGAAHLKGAQIFTLSGGELQRILLARAVAGKPDLLVLDEPLQGVDVAGEAALYEMIAHLRTRLNCGILLISHDLHMIMASSDQVVCLNGTVCCRGRPADVAASKEYNALFASHSRYVLGHQHLNSLPASFVSSSFEKNPPLDIVPPSYDEALSHA